jgi:Na+-driven multidrug efflux pump
MHGVAAPQAAAILPWVILSQPITALAFTLDGVLYGAR